MKSITAQTAKNNFGQFINDIQREPVAVTKHGRVVGVMVSEHDYNRMQGNTRDRLASTIEKARQEATENGLTPELLNHLLHGE
ncbi:MAG: type II toxin-antitoxin system prevent-host-death family antitoxin [Gammaproteobacteria bacterium]|nr:type II toxin-antitoxin system prevent-host-death family antitoxin [Gammaproteobacteria bacterium]